MKKFNIQKILIPVDFSETAFLALKHAVFMAKLYKAEVTLLHMIESYTFTSAMSHSVGNVEASFEFAHHNRSSRHRYVEGTVLLWVGWCNDRHQVKTIADINTWIPDRKTFF